MHTRRWLYIFRNRIGIQLNEVRLGQYIHVRAEIHSYSNAGKLKHKNTPATKISRPILMPSAVIYACAAQRSQLSFGRSNMPTDDVP